MQQAMCPENCSTGPECREDGNDDRAVVKQCPLTYNVSRREGSVTSKVGHNVNRVQGQSCIVSEALAMHFSEVESAFHFSGRCGGEYGVRGPTGQNCAEKEVAGT